MYKLKTYFKNLYWAYFNIAKSHKFKILEVDHTEHGTSIKILKKSELSSRSVKLFCPLKNIRFDIVPVHVQRSPEQRLAYEKQNYQWLYLSCTYGNRLRLKKNDTLAIIELPERSSYFNIDKLGFVIFNFSVTQKDRAQQVQDLITLKADQIEFCVNEKQKKRNRKTLNSNETLIVYFEMVYNRKTQSIDELLHLKLWEEYHLIHLLIKDDNFSLLEVNNLQ